MLFEFCVSFSLNFAFLRSLNVAFRFMSFSEQILCILFFECYVSCVLCLFQNKFCVSCSLNVTFLAFYVFFRTNFVYLVL